MAGRAPPGRVGQQPCRDRSDSNRRDSRHSVRYSAGSYDGRTGRRQQYPAGACCLPGNPHLTRHVAAAILRQALLVGDELFPINIIRNGGLEADRPFAQGDPSRRAADPWPSSARLLAPAAIDVSACISRILQNAADPGGIRLSPNDLMRRWTEQGPHRQAAQAEAGAGRADNTSRRGRSAVL